MRYSCHSKHFRDGLHLTGRTGIIGDVEKGNDSAFKTLSFQKDTVTNEKLSVYRGTQVNT